MSDFDAARRHVQLAAEYYDLPASKVDSLMTAFDIAARSSLDGDVKFLDLHGKPLLDEAYRDADVAAWLRYTARVSPHLLAKPADAPETTGTATAKAPSSAADYMQAVRDGAMTAEDATARMMSARPTETVPAPAMSATGSLAPNGISALMARVRNGDVGAQAELDRAMTLALSQR